MFYEETQINNVLNCIKCNQRLDEPRMLPCGEIICNYCQISIEINNNQFKCFICNEYHLMPKEGLTISKRLLKILALEPKEVYRSKEVDALKNHLNDFQQKINLFAFGINNGVDRIKQHCLDLKNKVQLRTEEVIEQLQDHSAQLVKEIEQFEKICIKSYQANEKASSELKKKKQELEQFNFKWNEYLKQSFISEAEICDGIATARELTIKCNEVLAKLDDFIFNGGELKFEKNQNKLEISVLGVLKLKEFNYGSPIMDHLQMLELMSLCKFQSNQNWKIIYRATKDGFGAADFHSKCDRYQNSFVIVRSVHGNVFGGYTEKSWSGNCGYKADPNAFLFSFFNQQNKKLVMKCTKFSNAIFTHSGYGPTFGRGHDLHICNYSNICNESYSNLDYSYTHSNYAYNSNEAKLFLAGSFNFLNTEIEVYTKE